MAKILVTGASGFIGQHLVRKLLDQGHSVRGTIHTEQPLYFIRADEIEWRRIDLSVPETLAGIATDIECIYHCAAIPRNDLRLSWEDFASINIKGAESLLAEAQRAGVKRFVYISTVEAAGYGDGKNPRRETDVPHPENNYGKSKLAAEEIVLSGPWMFERTVVRLPMIYGPGTFLIVPKLFGMVKRGWYPCIGSGTTGMEFCYIANAVDALILAGASPRAAGELFYVSDERSYTIREVISHIAAAMHKRVIFISIPKAPAYAIALLWEFAARIAPFPPIVSPHSKKPFFTRETVRWTTSDINIVSTEKIRSLLGYRPAISIAEGCARTAEWLAAHS
jgi:UDP-glucose 4-epimerase